MRQDREAAMGELPVEEAVDLSALVLDVYESPEVWWHPEHGDVVPPEGWVFPPSGEAFVTRVANAARVFRGGLLRRTGSGSCQGDEVAHGSSSQFEGPTSSFNM